MIKEILEFIFSNFFYFLGFMFILHGVIGGIVKIIYAIKGKDYSDDLS